MDWIGVDLYNQDCGTRAASYKQDTFEHLIGGTLRWRDTHAPGLPIALPEWGAPEFPGDPSARADWLRGAASTVKRTSAIQMMVYWDGGTDTFSGCDFSIRPGQPAFQVFQQIGADPYFRRSD